jgi:hypothetical protein
LPAIPLEIPFQLEVSSDPPRLWNLRGPEGVIGYRAERITLSAEESGVYRLPATTLPWWDVAHQQWQQASLPAWTLIVETLDVASRRPTPDWRRTPDLQNAELDKGAIRDLESSVSGSEQNHLLWWIALPGVGIAMLLGAYSWRRRHQHRNHG